MEPSEEAPMSLAQQRAHLFAAIRRALHDCQAQAKAVDPEEGVRFLSMSLEERLVLDRAERAAVRNAERDRRAARTPYQAWVERKFDAMLDCLDSLIADTSIDQEIYNLHKTRIEEQLRLQGVLVDEGPSG